jgi:hypothetical protein
MEDDDRLYRISGSLGTPLNDRFRGVVSDKLAELLSEKLDELVVKRRVEKFSDFIRPYGDAAGQIAKISSISAIILGTALLAVYLRSVGAPFPSLASATGAYLMLLSAMFLVVFVPVVFIVLLPDYSKMMSRKTLEPVFRELYLDRLSSGNSGDYFKSHLSYYFPLHLSALACLVYVWFSWGPLLVWLGASVMLGLFGLFLFLRKWKKCDRKTAIDVTWASAFSCVIAPVIWLSLIVPVLLSFAQQIPELAKWDQRSVLTLFVLILWLLHVVLSIGGSLRKLAGVAAMAIVFMILFLPGAAYLGAFALRSLGAGGGIPVSLRFRTSASGVPLVSPNPVIGCLVLSLGNDVLIQPGVAASECAPKLHRDVEYVKPYNGIVRYSLSDVLSISKFDDGCGTTDGISPCEGQSVPK